MNAAESMDKPGIALLSSSVRRRIVEHLAALPRLAVGGTPTRDLGLTAAELGRVLDLHSTTVRFHLDQLVAGGLVSAHFVRGGGAGRPAKRYAVEEGELSSLTQPRAEGPYQVLATLLAEALAQDGAERTTPEEAGREWALRRLAAATTPLAPSPEPASTPGGWVGKVGLVLDLLQEWGYHPDLQVGGREADVTLVLRDCPFLDLARLHPALVCGVHRGLLRGALEAAGESQAGVSLRPFVEERTCHAVLVRHDPHPSDEPPQHPDQTDQPGPDQQESTDE